MTAARAAAPSPRRGARGPAADIVSDLRRRIASQDIPPGAKLREQDLAREYAVSRPRIREALAVLELRGLVERIPNKGAVVSRMDAAAVFAIYDVREVLEGLCVRRAAENEPAAAWDAWLKRFDRELERRVRAGDVESYEREFVALRQHIIAAARNPVLAGMLDGIDEKTHIIMRRVLVLPGRAERGLQEVRAFLTAMRDGKPEKAEQLRRANIRSAIAELKRYQRFVL